MGWLEENRKINKRRGEVYSAPESPDHGFQYITTHFFSIKKWFMRNEY